jgi:HK97 family phage prohead protease
MARSTYRPTKAMQVEGQRALDWIAAGKAGDGFTATGRARAGQLARGEALSLDVVLRMYSYLARHEVDKQGQGFDPGDDNYPSPGRVAWAAWGGDPGLAWSTRIRNEAGQASNIGDSVIEKRDLPPSYRPSTSDDVPVFRPACASCQYFYLVPEADGSVVSGMCIRWEAPVASTSYCDAWEACDDMLPGWLSDDEEMNEDDESMVVDDPTDMAMPMMYSSTPSTHTRADISSLKVGMFVKWDSSGGGARGKIEKIVTKGPATGSTGFQMEAIPGDPVLIIRVFNADGNGWTASDLTVTHRADTLTIIDDLPAPRSWTPDMEARWQQLRGVTPEVDLEARRGAIAGADRRTFSSEVRAAQQSDGTVRMSGYAAMWDREADGLPFREVIKRGAFADSLGRGDDVFLLVNHDTDQLPLARRSAGTLSVAEDDMGLHVTAELDPANPRAAELASALERGDVDKMSFAFRVAADGSTKTEDGVRELRALDLYEVSVVTWPAYNATSVGLRSADDDLHLRWKRAHLRAKSRAL